MKIIFLTLSLLLLPICSAFPITLDDAIKTAVENSESGKIVKLSEESKKAEAAQTASSVKPQINAKTYYYHLYGNSSSSGGGSSSSSYGGGSDGYSYSYSTTDTNTSSSSSSPDRYISLELTASQLLFKGKKIWHTLDLEKTINHYAELTGKTGVRDIKKEVKNAFDKFFFQNATLDILTDRVKQRSEELEDAKLLKEVGMVTGLDVRQANLNLNSALIEKNDGEATLRNALIEFNRVIGEDMKGELLVPEGHLDRAANLMDTLEVLRKAHDKDTLIDIQVAKTSMEVNKLKHKLAKDDYYPEITFSARGRTSAEDFKNLDEDSYNIGIMMNWDILSGGSIKANKTKALADLSLSQEELNKLRKQLSSTIETLFTDAKSYRERIKLQEETVELARKNYEDAREHYRAGTIMITDLGGYNLSYAEARFKLIQFFYLERALLIATQSLLE
ncbi:MAG: TolC family protein [Candidatus Magnetoovum sp. WYHC-5]|nr:TolC family protein [Candidatus Magnetoovum sp. WYHC-5]